MDAKEQVETSEDAVIAGILALEKLHEDPNATYEDMVRAVLSLVSDEAEWWASERLDLQAECREALASETAAIERGILLGWELEETKMLLRQEEECREGCEGDLSAAEKVLRELEDELAEAAGRGASPGELAALSAKAHNALMPHPEDQLEPAEEPTK